MLCGYRSWQLMDVGEEEGSEIKGFCVSLSLSLSLCQMALHDHRRMCGERRKADIYENCTDRGQKRTIKMEKHRRKGDKEKKEKARERV